MAASGQSQWVYLDHAATTPVDRRVAQIMTTFLNGDDCFGNPSSVDHPFGWAAREWVEKARGQVAALIGAKPAEIIWTSGATESNNLAILGGARYHSNRGKHIVTSRIEHPATFDTCRQLEKEGFRVTYLKPDRVGMIHPRQVAEALSSDTILASIMHVNNEIGVVNDIAAIGELCRGRGIAFHVDAAQSAGKLPIDVIRQHIDLLSLSAHKMSGPKGIGALYVRREPPLGLQPLIFGGGQEAGMRSGTLPTHQIVGMGAACEIARNEGPAQARQLQVLRDRLWERLSKMPATQLNGDLQRLAPHILNVCFNDVEGESLIAALHKHHVAVSSGSACSSASREPSYVLRALGRSDAQAQASLRFSFGRGIGEEDVDRVAEAVHQAVTLLRELSPASEEKDATFKRAGSAPTIDPSSPGWISGEAGGIEQGTWVRFHVRTDGGQAGRQAGRQVIEARYKVYGCPQTMAAAEWVVQRLPGRRLDALLPEGVRILAQAVDLPPEKLGRLLPIEDALRRIGRPWPSP